MSLQGRKIILGVTGSIAAYKTPELVRQLVKAGAEVKVLLTQDAGLFVSSLSLSTVSKNPVLSDVTDGQNWNNHVALGLWADALLVAPCTAHSLARLSIGLCDNLISAVYLSARCPVFIAPAMDEDMWKHPSTQTNLERLKSYGNHILPVGHGELASGLVGPGRMMEPEDLVAYLQAHFTTERSLTGVKALVTAGPTYERLDPVRFIGNFSSGKMGIAIADALCEKGAEVTLVLGPTHLRPTHPNVKLLKVESADDMFAACQEHFPQSDITVMSAAVADYKPAHKAEEKIKKKDDALSLSLIKNRDILATLGSTKKPHQIVVGFALETQNALDHGKEKLQKKNADLIVLNSTEDAGAGFAVDTNKVTFLTPHNEPDTLPLMAKTEVAKRLVERIIAIRNEKDYPA